MPVAHELAPVSSPDSVGASCLPLANRTRAGRRDCGGGAPFCAALRAALCAMRSQKNRASQKQRSDFLAAPVHMAPPGRQKSEREFCLFGGGFCARRAAPCAGLAVLARPAAVMLAFVPGVPAFFPQALHTRGDSLAPSVLFACRALCVRSSVLFWLSVCLFRVGCTRVFLLSLIFCPFLPNFFLSNFFSLVAQAATGLYFLPKRK